MKNVQDIVDKYYDKMFNEVIKIMGDNFYDISVEIITLGGLTVRRSWKKREEVLKEENSEQD